MEKNVELQKNIGEDVEIMQENDLPEEIKTELDKYKKVYWSSNDLGSLEIAKIEKITYKPKEKMVKYKITGEIKKTGNIMPDESSKRFDIPNKPIEIIISIDENGNIKSEDNGDMSVSKIFEENKDK